MGVSWHRHYQRLHLHTDKRHSELPFAPFPKEYPRYPSRMQMISYLEAYARRFHLEPRLGQQVVSARQANGIWEVQTQDTRYQASNLVIATGYNREPWLPTWPGQDSFQGSILHSSQYRNGEPFKGQKVLIVGFGNSGGEIAIVTGTLLQEGWGAAVGYPGIVLDEHGGEVNGFLFSSESLAEHWARLDEFEGEGYERVLTTVKLKDGTVVDAYIYRLSGNGSPGR